MKPGTVLCLKPASRMHSIVLKPVSVFCCGPHLERFAQSHHDRGRGCQDLKQISCGVALSTLINWKVAGRRAVYELALPMA